VLASSYKNLDFVPGTAETAYYVEKELSDPVFHVLVKRAKAALALLSNFTKK